MTHSLWKEDTCGEWEEDVDSAVATSKRKDSPASGAKNGSEGAERTAAAAIIGEVIEGRPAQEEGKEAKEENGEEKKEEHRKTPFSTAGQCAAMNPCETSQQKREQQQTDQLGEVVHLGGIEEQHRGGKNHRQQKDVTEQSEYQKGGCVQLQQQEREKEQLLLQQEHVAHHCRQLKQLPLLDASASDSCLLAAEMPGDPAAALAVAAGACPGAVTCPSAAASEADCTTASDVVGCSSSDSPAAGERVEAAAGTVGSGLTEVEGFLTWQELLRDPQLASSIKPGEWIVDIGALLRHPAVVARGSCAPEQLQESIPRTCILSLTEGTSHASGNIGSGTAGDSRRSTERSICRETPAARGSGNDDERESNGSRVAMAEDHKDSSSSGAVAKDSSCSSAGADELGSGRASRRSGTSDEDETGRKCIEAESESQLPQPETEVNSGADSDAAPLLRCTGAAAAPEGGPAAEVRREPYAAAAQTVVVASSLHGNTAGAASDGEGGAVHAFRSAEGGAEEGEASKQQQEYIESGDVARRESSSLVSSPSTTGTSAYCLPRGSTRRLCVRFKVLFGDKRSTMELHDVPAAVAVADTLQLILQSPDMQKALEQQRETQQEDAKQQHQALRKTATQQQQQEEIAGQGKQTQEQPGQEGLKATDYLRQLMSHYSSARSSAAAAATAGGAQHPQQAAGGGGSQVSSVSIMEQLLQRDGGEMQQQQQYQGVLWLQQQQALQQQLETLQLLQQETLHKQQQQQLLLDGTGSGAGYALPSPVVPAQQRQRRGGSCYPQQRIYGQQRGAVAAANQPRIGGSTHRRQATTVVVTDGRCTSSGRGTRSSGRRSHHAAPPPPPPDCCCPLCWGHLGSSGGAANGVNGMCNNRVCCCGSSPCSRSSGVCGSGRMFRGLQGFYPVCGPVTDMCQYPPHTRLLASARGCCTNDNMGHQGNVCGIACPGATRTRGRRAAAAPYGADVAALSRSCDCYRALSSAAANGAVNGDGRPGNRCQLYEVPRGALQPAPGRHPQQQQRGSRRSNSSGAYEPARDKEGGSHRVARSPVFSIQTCNSSSRITQVVAAEPTEDIAELAVEPEATAATAGLPVVGETPAAEAEATGAQGGERVSPAEDGDEDVVAAGAANHEGTHGAQAGEEAAAGTDKREAADTLDVAKNIATGEQRRGTLAAACPLEELQTEAITAEPLRHRWSSVCSSVASSRSSSGGPPTQRATPQGEAVRDAATVAQAAATLAEAGAGRRAAPLGSSAVASADEVEPPSSATECAAGSFPRKSAECKDSSDSGAVPGSAACGTVSPERVVDSSQSPASSPSDSRRRSSSRCSWRSVEEGTAFLCEGEEDVVALSACATEMTEWHGGAARGAGKVLCGGAGAAGVGGGDAEEGKEKRDEFPQAEHSCHSSGGSTASVPEVEHYGSSSTSSDNCRSSNIERSLGAGTATAVEVDGREKGEFKDQPLVRMEVSDAGRRCSRAVAAGAGKALSEEQHMEGTGVPRAAVLAAACKETAAAAHPGWLRLESGGSRAAAEPDNDEKEEGTSGAGGPGSRAEAAAAAATEGEATAAEAQARGRSGDARAAEYETEAAERAAADWPEGQECGRAKAKEEAEAAATEGPETASSAREEADGNISRGEAAMSADACCTDDVSGAAGVPGATAAAAAADATPGHQQLMYLYPCSSSYSYDEQQLHQNGFGYAPSVSGASAEGEGAAEARRSAGAAAGPAVNGDNWGAADSALAAEYYCAYYWHQYYIAAAAAASAENGDVAAAAAAVGKSYMAAVAATNAAAAACSRAAAGDSHFQRQARLSTRSQPGPWEEKRVKEWREDETSTHQPRTLWTCASEAQQAEAAGTTEAAEEAGGGAARGERDAETAAAPAAEGPRGLGSGARGGGEGAAVGTDAAEVFSAEAAAAAVAKHFAATAAISAVEHLKNAAGSQQLQQREERCMAANSPGPLEWKGGTLATASSSSNTVTCRRRTGYNPAGTGGLKTTAGGGTFAAAAGRRRNGGYAGGGHMQRCGATDCWYTSVNYADWPLHYSPELPPPPEQPLRHSGRRMCYRHDGAICGGVAAADGGRREYQSMQSARQAQREQERGYWRVGQQQQRQRQQHHEKEEHRRRHADEKEEEEEEEAADIEEAKAMSDAKKLKEPQQDWGQVEGGGYRNQEMNDSVCTTPSLLAAGAGDFSTHKVGETDSSEGWPSTAVELSPGGGCSTTATLPANSTYRRGTCSATDLSDNRRNSNRGFDAPAEGWPSMAPWNEEGAAAAAGGEHAAAGGKRRAPSRSNRPYVRDTPAQQRQHNLQHHVYPPHYQQPRYPFCPTQLQQPIQHQQQCCPQQLPHHYVCRPAHHQQQQCYRRHYPGPQQQHYYPHTLQHQQQYYFHPHPHYVQQPYHYYHVQQCHRSVLPRRVDMSQGSLLRGGGGGGGRRWRNMCTGGGAGTGGGAAEGDVVGSGACRPNYTPASGFSSGSVGGGFFDGAEGHMAAGAGPEGGGRCFYGCEAEHVCVDDGAILSVGAKAETTAAGGGENGTTCYTERSTRAPHCIFAAVTHTLQRPVRGGTRGRDDTGEPSGRERDIMVERRSAGPRRGATPAAGRLQRRALSSHAVARSGSRTRDDESADQQRKQRPPRKHPSALGMHAAAAACPSLEGPDFPSLSISVAAAKLTKKATSPPIKGGTCQWADIEEESLVRESASTPGGDPRGADTL